MWLDEIRTEPHETGLTGRAGRFQSHFAKVRVAGSNLVVRSTGTQIGVPQPQVRPGLRTRLLPFHPVVCPSFVHLFGRFVENLTDGVGRCLVAAVDEVAVDVQGGRRSVCPSLPATTDTGTPAVSIVVAMKCRRSWSRTHRGPLDRATGPNASTLRPAAMARTRPARRSAVEVDEFAVDMAVAPSWVVGGHRKDESTGLGRVAGRPGRGGWVQRWAMRCGCQPRSVSGVASQPWRVGGGARP